MVARAVGERRIFDGQRGREGDHTPHSDAAEKAEQAEHFRPATERAADHRGTEDRDAEREQAAPFHALAQRTHQRGADHHAGERAACEERSEEHTSELQSLMRISYAVFCLKKKNTINKKKHTSQTDILLQISTTKTLIQQ